MKKVVISSLLAWVVGAIIPLNVATVGIAHANNNSIPGSDSIEKKDPQGNGGGNQDGELTLDLKIEIKHDSSAKPISESSSKEPKKPNEENKGNKKPPLVHY